MIVEQEILEQLLLDDWPLSRVIAFLRDADVDAWRVIARHTQERNVCLVDSKGDALPDWRVQEIIRTGRADAGTMVHCTAKGAEIAT